MANELVDNLDVITELDELDQKIRQGQDLIEGQRITPKLRQIAADQKVASREIRKRSLAIARRRQRKAQLDRQQRLVDQLQ